MLGILFTLCVVWVSLYSINAAHQKDHAFFPSMAPGKMTGKLVKKFGDLWRKMYCPKKQRLGDL